ncbi:hypothetical protein LS70_002980 [Helicobacter sp. MIT 11-5569]|uniref:DUF6033 family protein n=1 Tax=Helicobacter sp. MIT 11-5569 TaxID=1548151 RepID=UPI00051FD9BA|nr:DUF6033 family protein [Helicobacter sp. MIT 11-5569]TLD84527.1 hypothetical protein LS70_002980 [Helicobacter sp. MIT 11-5569]
MAVSLHGEWVSSAAYDYAKTQEFKKQSAAEVLRDLQSKFKDLNINGGGQQGTNNLTISSNILQQMATNKETKEKYEALIYDINETIKSQPTTTLTGAKVKASGFIIGEDGGLSAWSIVEGGSKKEEKSFMEKLMENLEKIQKEQEAKAKKAKEEQKQQDEKQSKVSIQITTKSLLDIES